MDYKPLTPLAVFVYAMFIIGLVTTAYITLRVLEAILRALGAYL